MLALLSPVASIGSSIDSFFDAAGTFFSSLAAVHWGALFIAVGLYLCHLVLRSRAWFNVLRAAYPGQRFQWRKIYGSYMAGIGINSIFPLHGGDVVKIYLAKNSVPNSRYPTVASSFFVESIFDMAIGLLVLLFALSQGVLPSFIQLQKLPAFDASYWASHPKLFLFLVTLLFVACVLVFALLAGRIEAFWQRVKQGWSMLRDRRRYLREVVTFQAFGWAMKLTAFYFFLEAFNIEATLRNALLVMSVQALSTLMFFTPGGAGAQQAFLVYIFKGVAPEAILLSYSVGQQVVIAIANAAVGFTCIYLMARTLDWKMLRRRGEQERRRAEEQSGGESSTPEVPTAEHPTEAAPTEPVRKGPRGPHEPG